ncbi:UNVERIFIED_CONTAM: hypothetical protein GTU68_057034 [Idotea baltica]|nr:hypothetical protein [Idotea baltica]
MHKEEKVALVTGAGSGIGRDIAVALLNQGTTVVLAGRRSEKLGETLALAKCPPDAALICPTDVTDQKAVQLLFEEIAEKYGKLDLLFNNAGINIRNTLLEDVSFEDWRALIDTNLTAAFLCTQEAFKIMKAQDPQGGRIINNGSISAQTPRPNSAPYSASKHAISGLTKSTALDGRKYNIACGQIDIGNASTFLAEEMTSGILQANGEIAVEPTMQVSHVTDAFLYMANLPLDVNVLSLTVMATKMPFVGRG